MSRAQIHRQHSILGITNDPIMNVITFEAELQITKRDQRWNALDETHRQRADSTHSVKRKTARGEEERNPTDIIAATRRALGSYSLGPTGEADPKRAII
eukprot:scaffold1332_cov42-Attheya_sp.AAC.3